MSSSSRSCGCGFLAEIRSVEELNYRKSSIKPMGVYLILDTPEGAYQRGGFQREVFFREGDFFRKLDEKYIDDSFISFFTSYFADSTFNFLSRIHIFDSFLSQPLSELTPKVFKPNRQKIFGNFWDSVCLGSLIKGEGASLNFGSEGRNLLERGLNGEEGLIEILQQSDFKVSQVMMHWLKFNLFQIKWFNCVTANAVYVEAQSVQLYKIEDSLSRDKNLSIKTRIYYSASTAAKSTEYI